MSRTSAFPVHTLTEDQAVEELAEIFDSAPPEEDQLARIHWSQENAARAQQLEQHIAHLQRRDGGPGGSPAPSGEQQVAPPPHLQPETAEASLPIPTKEKTVPAKKTPKEKLQSLVDSYHVLVAKLQDDPTNRRYRDDASTCKSRMSNLERDFHLTRPELQPIPSIKMGRPANPPTPTIDQVLDQHLSPLEEQLAHAVSVMEPEPDPVLSKACPDLTVHINTEGIRGLPQEAAEQFRDAVKSAIADQGKRPAGPYVMPTAESLRGMLDIAFVHIDEAPLEEAPVHEEVNHPSHYTQGAVECIDALQSALGDEAFVAYCRASAMKYLWRTGKKGPAETDLRKAAWYVTRALEVTATLGAEESVA